GAVHGMEHPRRGCLGDRDRARGLLRGQSRRGNRAALWRYRDRRRRRSRRAPGRRNAPLATANGDELVRLLFAAIATLVSLGFAAPTTTESVPPFAHVVVVVFENKEYENVIGNPYAPNFNRLAAAGALLT